MRLMMVAALAGAALTLGACAYNAPVAISPNLNVYSSYGDKLPGSYLLYVESSGLVQRVKPTGLSCAAHSFPLDVQSAFTSSVVKTMEQLVESVEVVSSPVATAELGRTGKAGMIIIRAENLRARIQFIPGFFSATADANVELSASLSVDGPGGRLLGTTAAGDGANQGGSGGACEGGATVLGQATEVALKELLGQLGERFSNSPRLRASGPTPAGPSPL
jgi:hypothetical protein